MFLGLSNDSITADRPYYGPPFVKIKKSIHSYCKQKLADVLHAEFKKVYPKCPVGPTVLLTKCYIFRLVFYFSLTIFLHIFRLFQVRVNIPELIDDYSVSLI